MIQPDFSGNIYFVRYLVNYCAYVADNKDSGIVIKTTISEIEKDFNLKLFNVGLSKNTFC